MEMIAEAFNKKYPNITVEHQFTEASDFQRNIKLVMQGDNPPDIIQYNTPVRDLGAVGLILDLSPYEKAYDWADKIPESLLDQTRFSQDGKTMGQGRLLAAPSTVPVVGVFYNKTKTDKAGISGVPKSFAEFEDDLKKMKESGQQPLEMGSLDFGGIHNWAALVNVHSNRDEYRDWLFGKSGATIETEGAKAASETMARWAKLGYYPASANGTGDGDAAARFAKGESGYLITGSWFAAMFRDALGDDVGFFPLPMVDTSQPLTASASVAAYAVSAKTKHPEAAAAFLDFLYSADAAPGIQKIGNLSLNQEANEGMSGVNADVAEVYSQVAEDDGAMIFPDQSAPALLDTLTSQIQLLVAGNIESEDMLKTVQQAWDEYHG